MKTAAVLCFLVVVVSSQMMEEQGFTKADFKAHRMESYDRFLEIAETNPIGALNNAVVDLVKGMQIGSYLVEKGMMPANKVVKKLLKTVTQILEDTIDILEIYAWAENVCSNRALPDHDVINMNPTYKSFRMGMNNRLPRMCRVLNLTYGPQK